MSANESLLICAGPHPYSERVAALLREEGLDATSVDCPPPPALQPIHLAAASFSPAIAALESTWLLYVRSGEIMPRALAKEVVRAVAANRAYAYRVKRLLFDRTVPLLLDDPLTADGEIRLMHRRRARFQADGRLTLQGTVVRLAEPMHVEVDESGLLEPNGSRRASVLRILLRRPWLVFHPPTLSFLVRNRRAISGWFDRAASERGSR